MAKPAFTKVYSGHLSNRFWRIINKLPTDSKKEMYSLGCVLQNTEHFVLNLLNNAVIDAKSRKKKCHA